MTLSSFFRFLSANQHVFFKHIPIRGEYESVTGAYAWFTSLVITTYGSGDGPWCSCIQLPSTPHTTSTRNASRAGDGDLVHKPQDARGGDDLRGPDESLAEGQTLLL